MSDSLHIAMPDLPGFTAAMQAAPQTLDAELLVAGNRISKRGHALSGTYVKRRTGNLANTIYSDAKSVPGGVEAYFGASAEYALPVDRGRAPGSKMPPQGVLLPFMNKVGIPESAEYAIRRKIARDGIPPAPFVSKAFAEMKSSGFILKEFGDAIKRTFAKIMGSR